MRAKDSVANYPSKLREYTNFSVRGIKKICKTYGPRAPGSEAEFEAQKAMQAELDTCCDKTFIDTYKIAPRAFMAWIHFGAVAMFIAAILNFFGFSLLALVLTVIELVYLLSEFICYKAWFDVLFKKADSHNVVGIRNPSGELKRRIVFSGHADSAVEWHFTYWGGPKLLMPVIISAVLIIIIALVSTITAVSMGYAFKSPDDVAFLRIMKYVLLCMSPLILSCLLFYSKNFYVMGANDNLTGCYTAMAVTKFMADNDIRFENTEVRILLTGSEECGLRGTKYYCKEHKEDMEDVETVFIGLDTMRDFEYTAVYRRDLNGTVKHDEQACNLLQAGAKQAGYDIPQHVLFFGSSDSTAVTQAGGKATTLASMDPAPARYYHTRLDTEDNLEPKAIENCINIALETAFLFDEKGFDV